MSRRRVALRVPCVVCAAPIRTFPYYITRGLRKYCSRACRVSVGRTHSPDGYVLVTCPVPGHPRAHGGRYILEHLLVAERALGRPLPRTVRVHHVNEIRTDNTPSNLVICENDAYHELLHVRARTLRAGGDPNSEKFCTGCQSVVPHAAFAPNPKACDGLWYWCRPCIKRGHRKVAL